MTEPIVVSAERLVSLAKFAPRANAKLIATQGSLIVPEPVSIQKPIALTVVNVRMPANQEKYVRTANVSFRVSRVKPVVKASVSTSNQTAPTVVNAKTSVLRAWSVPKVPAK